MSTVQNIPIPNGSLSSFQSDLNGHPNLIGYVDSTISLLDGGVHTVLLLMPYHKTTLLQTTNGRINSGRFSEAEVVDIFCNMSTAVSRLHHCQTPIIHRDLKVGGNLSRLLDYFLIRGCTSLYQSVCEILLNSLLLRTVTI
jgi:serine/threonine protein kinase